jgi:hypothetical protein
MVTDARVRKLRLAEDPLERFEKNPAILFMEPAQFPKRDILLNCSYEGFDHGGLEKACFLPRADWTLLWTLQGRRSGILGFEGSLMKTNL